MLVLGLGEDPELLVTRELVRGQDARACLDRDAVPALVLVAEVSPVAGAVTDQARGDVLHRERVADRGAREPGPNQTPRADPCSLPRRSFVLCQVIFRIVPNPIGLSTPQSLQTKLLQP